MSSAWGYAVAGDGSPLFYESWGERDTRSPLLYCDGIGCDGYVWRYLRQDVGPRFALHPHYRGHGRTAAPRDPARVTVEDLADDIASVLDDALVDRAVLVGHSMGVQVALETYRRHAQRVAGLVLVCGAPSHPLKTFNGSDTLEKILPTLQKWIGRAPGFINSLSRRLLPTRLAFEIATLTELRRELVEPQDFMPYLEGMSKIDIRLFLRMLSNAGEHSADDLLERIAVPSLIIAGGRDGFTPPDRSRAMAEAIPGATLLEIPNASHTAPIERPDLISAALLEFLATRIDVAADDEVVHFDNSSARE
ncbi:MAG TPA: alpha/beta fold hydrolase [Kofleriaceae bacterium]|jgi:pimeloyl-ACP methyl ester carboxylesterase